MPLLDGYGAVPLLDGYGAVPLLDGYGAVPLLDGYTVLDLAEVLLLLGYGGIEPDRTDEDDINPLTEELVPLATILTLTAARALGLFVKPVGLPTRAQDPSLVL